jgi:type IV pilus assembly protein PilF
LPRNIVAVVLATGVLAACAGGPTAPTSPAASPQEIAALNVQLGMAYLQEGNLDLARNRLLKAVTVAPDYSEAHLGLAVMYEGQGQDELAETHFREALRLDPTSPHGHTNYGSFLCSRGRTAEGEQQFQTAVANPAYEHPELAFTNAGLCLLRAGQPDRAEEYLRRGLDADPRLPRALLAMASLQARTGRYPAARGYLDRYESAGPPTPESLELGARIERGLGNPAGASRYYRSLLSQFPESSEARQMSGGRAL